MPVQGVIFDIDGTLVDSNAAHAHAWAQAFAEHGYPVTFEQVIPLIGMGGDHLLPHLIGVPKDSDVGRSLSTRRSEIFKANYLPKLRPFPQVRALVEHIRAAGGRVAVASSAQAEELDALLNVAGIADLIETATSSGDAERSKPDPDILQAALERLRLPAAQAVMVGDTEYDVTAADKAGVPCIGLRCGGHSDDQLGGAVAIYDDPADLLAHYDTSPLAG